VRERQKWNYLYYAISAIILRGAIVRSGVIHFGFYVIMLFIGVAAATTPGREELIHTTRRAPVRKKCFDLK
jgi:hypothetical protein